MKLSLSIRADYQASFSKPMIARRILGSIAAIILFLAGLGAGVTCVRALKDGDIMSTGRRSSHLVQKENEPVFFWVEPR